MKTNILTAKVAGTGLTYYSERLAKKNKLIKFATNLASGYDNENMRHNILNIMSSENEGKAVLYVFDSIYTTLELIKMKSISKRKLIKKIIKISKEKRKEDINNPNLHLKRSLIAFCTELSPTHRARAEQFCKDYIEKLNLRLQRRL